jgi:zinc protease
MSVSPARWTTGVVRTKLSNGLTVLVQSDPTMPAVAVVTHVKAGFFDEPDRWVGISHVLEHMFFKGTPTRGVGQIAAETKSLGGYLNASTSYDATSYFVVLPASGFQAALAIQADALRNSVVDDAELKRELVVIIEEAKRKLDTPGAVAHERLHAILFDRHRIRRWRIGTEAELARYTRDDVVGYYRSRYVPERVTVAVVGNVGVDEALAAIEARYGDWASAPGAVDRSPEEPWRRGVRAELLEGDVRQTELAIGWRGVPPLDRAAAPLDLAAMVLSAGRGGWLYQRVRQPGLVTSVGAYHYSPTEVGVFTISVDVAPAQVVPALQAIGAEIARLRSAGPGAEDLARVKTVLTVQWARRLESVEGRATAFAGLEALGGFELLEDEFARLQAVTPAEVREVAERFLDPDSVAGVAYRPTGQGVALTVDALRTAFGAAPSANGHHAAAATLEVPAATRPIRRREEAGVTHLALPGVDVLLRPKRGVPLATLGGYRRRWHTEEREHAGLGALTVRAATRGAGPWSSSELALVLERLGGSLGANIGVDWWGYSASVAAENLGPAAAVLREVLESPTFDPAEVIRERDTLVEEAVQAADDMFRYPVQLALMAAFGSRDYGLPVKGLPDSLAGLSVEQVRDWHAGERARSRLAIVAVGDFETDRAADLLAGVFERLDPIPSGMVPPGPPPLIRPGTLVEPRAKSQTAIAMVFPGPARTAPTRYAAEVMSAITSGLAGRLFLALRDQRSLAYVVVMSSWQRARAGAILTYIATSPEREAEARDSMLVELDRLRSELVTEEELARAVRYLVGQVEVQRQTGSAIASELLDAWLVGTGLDELEDPTGGYRAVSRDDLRALAEACLSADQRAEGIVVGQKA